MGFRVKKWAGQSKKSPITGSWQPMAGGDILETILINTGSHFPPQIGSFLIYLALCSLNISIVAVTSKGFALDLQML